MQEDSKSPRDEFSSLYQNSSSSSTSNSHRLIHEYIPSDILGQTIGNPNATTRLSIVHFIIVLEGDLDESSSDDVNKTLT